jgi:hypothetical protein
MEPHEPVNLADAFPRTRAALERALAERPITLSHARQCAKMLGAALDVVTDLRPCPLEGGGRGAWTVALLTALILLIAISMRSSLTYRHTDRGTGLDLAWRNPMAVAAALTAAAVGLRELVRTPPVRAIGYGGALFEQVPSTQRPPVPMIYMRPVKDTGMAFPATTALFLRAVLHRAASEGVPPPLPPVLRAAEVGPSYVTLLAADTDMRGRLEPQITYAVTALRRLLPTLDLDLEHPKVQENIFGVVTDPRTLSAARKARGLVLGVAAQPVCFDFQGEVSTLIIRADASLLSDDGALKALKDGGAPTGTPSREGKAWIARAVGNVDDFVKRMSSDGHAMVVA